MARDGSGNYTLPEAAFVPDTVANATAVNSDFSDIASALTASIAKDGQTTPTADLPMGGYNHTGLGTASAAADSLSLGQAQAEAFIWCGTAGGTADAITLTPTPSITAYAAGQRFAWIAGASPNTGAATVAISGLATKAIQRNGAALVADDVVAGKLYQISYDGTQFQLMPVQTAATLTGTETLTNKSLTSPTITGGVITGITDITVTDGGTGASTAAAARANLEIEYATQAEQEAATATDKVVAPGTQQYHPGTAKFWVKFNGTTGAIQSSHNVTSVVRNSAGDYTITIATDFSDATWACLVSAENQASVVVNGSVKNTGQAAGTVVIQYNNSTTGAAADPVYGHVIGFGDQ